MADIRDWFRSSMDRRVTVEQIGEVLGVSRATATRYVADGLDAAQIIALCDAFGANPIEALVDLGHIDYRHVIDFLDGDDRTISAAEDGELALELARRLNPAKLAPVIDDIEARARR